jgi:hypothetical protein
LLQEHLTRRREHAFAIALRIGSERPCLRRKHRCHYTQETEEILPIEPHASYGGCKWRFSLRFIAKEAPVRSIVRLFLFFEGASFALAGRIHAGLLGPAWAHGPASVAETVIAAVLLGGLALTWLWPVRTQLLALGSQAFALLGTLVGLFTIAVGVGPRTVPDVLYHLGIVVVLACGLGVAVRSLNDRSAHYPLVASLFHAEGIQ